MSAVTALTPWEALLNILFHFARHKGCGTLTPRPDWLRSAEWEPAAYFVSLRKCNSKSPNSCRELNYRVRATVTRQSRSGAQCTLRPKAPMTGERKYVTWLDCWVIQTVTGPMILAILVGNGASQPSGYQGTTLPPRRLFVKQMHGCISPSLQKVSQNLSRSPRLPPMPRSPMR
jgi:hypothetical protein